MIRYIYRMTECFHEFYLKPKEQRCSRKDCKKYWNFKKLKYNPWNE